MIFLGNWRERWDAFFILASIEYISWLVLPIAPRNDFYYAACGTFNIIALSAFLDFKKTPLSVDLVILTYMQIFLQFAGFVRYTLYFSEEVYNRSIHSIVVISFLRILMAGDHDRNRRNSARPFSWRVFFTFIGLGEKQADRISK